MGDPAGVGPEILIKALADPAVRQRAVLLIVGNANIFEQAIALVGASLPIRRVQGFDDPRFDPEAVNVLDVIDLAHWSPGQIQPDCGRAAVQAVETATRMVLQGEADGIVTAPLHKAAAHQASFPFPGHTEFLASLCGVAETRLMLVCDELRVVHATGHLSLRQVLDILTPERIVETVELTLPTLRWLGYEQPRIAVAALNPHAGEQGKFGNEDDRIVAPAVRQLQAAGHKVFGPVPADTVFWQAKQGAFDLVVALYHDQGHIPVKVLAFERAVNVTAGLPIIRTSPDHGVAFDIAWQNKANAESMKAAILLAAKMAQRKAAEATLMGKTAPRQ